MIDILNSDIQRLDNLAVMRKRASENIFIIRGFAIFLVVLGHVIGDKDAGTGIRQFYPSDLMELAQISRFIYTFHMPIFFLSSGFSFVYLSKSNHSLLSFIISKVRRLLIPWVCWAPIYYLIKSAMGKKDLNFLAVIQSVVNADFIFWFFPAIFFASIVGYICLKKFNSWALYSVLSIFLFALSFCFQGTISVWFYFNCFYFLGCVLGLYLLSRSEKLDFPTWISVLLFFALMSSSLLFEGISLSPLVTKFFSGLSSFILLYILIDARETSSRSNLIRLIFNTSENIFGYFGKISMSIYLLHVISGSSIRTFLVKFGILDPSTQLILGLLASILGPILIHNLLRKNTLFLYSIGEAK
jgi:fucose 4-O-acetylase-like acetyltransferase